MPRKPKRPKLRVPLPKKTEKIHPDKSKYTRKGKHTKATEGTSDGLPN